MNAQPCTLEAPWSSFTGRNWSDERWVAFITINTMEWMMLSLNARMVFPLLLRAVDQAGTIRLGRYTIEDLGVLLQGPRTKIAEGVRELMGQGLVKVDNGLLTIVDYRSRHLPTGKYVRLYTEDTANWLSLSYEARGLFCLMLRKANRSGLISLGQQGPEGLARVMNADWSEVQGPLEELLTRGYGCVKLLTLDDGTKALVLPNFTAAQEARQSDAARQRVCRERRRCGLPSTSRSAARPAPAESPKSAPAAGEPSSGIRPVAAAKPDHSPTLPKPEEPDMDDAHFDPFELEESAPATIRDPKPWFQVDSDVAERAPEKLPVQPTPLPDTERSEPAPIKVPVAAEPALANPLALDPSTIPETADALIALLGRYPLFAAVAPKLGEQLYGTVVASGIAFGVFRDAVNDFALKNTSVAQEEQWNLGRLGRALGGYIITAHRRARCGSRVDTHSSEREPVRAEPLDRHAQKFVDSFTESWCQRMGDSRPSEPNELSVARTMIHLCRQKASQINRPADEIFRRVVFSYFADQDKELEAQKFPFALLPFRMDQYATDEVLLPAEHPGIVACRAYAPEGYRQIMEALGKRNIRATGTSPSN